jgi:hypothetical protein
MWTTIVSIPTSLSLEEPKKTIQAALDLTLDRDTVLVDDGIYATGGIGVNASPLLSRVGIAKAVTVMSVNGPELTIIEGRGGVGQNAAGCAYSKVSLDELERIFENQDASEVHGLSLDVLCRGTFRYAKRLETVCEIAGHAKFGRPERNRIA